MAEGTTAAPARTATTSKKHHAGFYVVTGLGFLALFIVGLFAEIQSSEALITNSGQIVSYVPNFALLMQIPDLFMGHPTLTEAKATILVWGIELVWFGFIIGQEIMNDSASKSGKQVASLSRIGTYIIIGYNFWSNYNYGTIGPEGVGGHILFSLVVAFLVGYFGIWGVAFIEHGWKRA